MKRSLSITALMAILAFSFNSCGGGKEDKSDATKPAADEQWAPAPVEEISNTLTLSAHDEMKYDQTVLKALAGKPITLTFTHIGTMDKNVMGHNFVLLVPGTDIDDFAKKALTAKDNDFIPKSESSKIIAHTKLLGGNESDTIEFTVPEKGTYDYICTFPGHVATMRGKLIVE
ncbi:plastocyanin/azurin family copper-binding protein [Pedobacter gandavensis]|uniref:Azurin n=1 Tax=Pedobacter gandavensis TaxID=2679963 RepID=A0ABR6EWC2_9SPHI|nr:azurin [Pedobacter gandavensis]MBB2149084.1 Azurin [Pedobacter gandavensis]